VNNDEMRPGYDTADAWLDDAIAAVVAFERAGRSVVAGAGLARLRERFEGGLGIDEDSAAAWAQFVTDRIPFPSARVNELLGQMVHRGGLLRCTKCGAAVRLRVRLRDALCWRASVDKTSQCERRRPCHGGHRVASRLVKSRHRGRNWRWLSNRWQGAGGDESRWRAWRS
jgi:hypothetical protein